MNGNKKIIVLMDGTYLDSLGVKSRPLAEKFKENYREDCEIRIYREFPARDDAEQMRPNTITIHHSKSSKTNREYDYNYKLLIDAVVARDTFDNIIIVSGNRSFLQVRPIINEAGKQVAFIFPDELTDIGSLKLENKGLDSSPDDCIVEVI